MTQFLKCLIVALLLLMPRAATAAISAGPTIDVPWLQYVPGFTDLATAAVLEDGSFAIAGLQVFLLTEHELTAQLEVQFFRADGAAQTRPLTLIQSPGVVDSAGVGSVGDRYFLVFKNDKSAYGLFYSEQGRPVGQPIRWPYSDISFFSTYYRFGDAPRWRFLPITYRLRGNDSGGNPIYRTFLRVAEPDGRLLGLPVELPDIGDAAINGRGQVVVVSERCPPQQQQLPCVQGIQLFDGAARPRTPILTADVPQFEEQPGVSHNSAADVAIGPHGQILLAWVTDLDKPAHRFVARLYHENGAAASDLLPVSPSALYLGGLASPIALADGTFVLSWIVQSPLDLTEKLVVARFDPGTMAFDDPVILVEGRIGGARLKLNGSGKGIIAWQSLDDAAVPTAGHVRVIEVNP